jgi:8-oxo-dGTP pyrophosphatase MutT (NUDIX family)
MTKTPNNISEVEETTQLPIKVENLGIVYEDKYKKIEKIHAHFEGFSKEYLVSVFEDKSAIVVVKGNDVLLVRQYRLFADGLSYEIPGGLLNPKETPQDAALRECFEETGVKCKNPRLLINYNPDLEYTRNYTHVFYTDEIEQVPTENLGKFVWIPLEECIKMIFEKKISDSLSLISILSYKFIQSQK